MSTRKQSCQHSHWAVLPGGIARCTICSEEVSASDLFIGSSPIHLEVSEAKNQICPLTFRMKDLPLLGGDPT